MDKKQRIKRLKIAFGWIVVGGFGAGVSFITSSMALGIFCLLSAACAVFIGASLIDSEIKQIAR